MCWGVSFYGLSPLVRVEGNQNSEDYCNTLAMGLTPWAPEVFGEISTCMFQQDNAPFHTSKFSLQWLTSHHVNTISCTEMYPDLNII